MNILLKLKNAEIINPDKWMIDNLIFMTHHGSYAYATNNEDSDFDYYGIVIPQKHVLFPNSAGIIKNFGNQGEDFLHYHPSNENELIYNKKKIDLHVYSIVRFCHLAMSSINVVETLFTAPECINHNNRIGEYLRENRFMFLSKQLAKNVKAYAYAQFHKTTGVDREGNRKKIVDEFGYDSKSLSHTVRLASEAEQILIEGNLDLRKNKEMIKAVRRGELKLDDVSKWFLEKDILLDKLAIDSKIPDTVNENKIKHILLNCLEMHYGDLSAIINKQDKGINDCVVDEIKAVLRKFNVV